MNENMEKTTRLLIERLKQRMGEELDIVFFYGSQLKGNTRLHSDFDLSYIPSEGSTKYNGITVMVDDVLYDLYPMDWASMDRLATYDNPSASLLFRTEVAYCREDKLLERFNGLRPRLEALLKPEAKGEMAKKALRLFRNLAFDHFRLSTCVKPGDLFTAKHLSIGILRGIAHCLGVANQACIDTRDLENLHNLALRPASFFEQAEILVNSQNVQAIQAACTHLMEETHALLTDRVTASCRNTTPLGGMFNYPEALNCLRSILSSCEKGNRYHALTSWTGYKNELAQVMARLATQVDYTDDHLFGQFAATYEAYGFPDLLPAILSGDVDAVRTGIETYDERYRKFFKENGVQLDVFKDNQALSAYLNALAD